MKLLLIIPAYNEEASVARVVGELAENYPQYDYVVVNDGSTDGTARVCRERGVHRIDLPVNLGLAGAFQTGVLYAYRRGYDCAMQFDADGQHLPVYIPSMLGMMESERADIVIGSRYKSEKKPKSLRMLGSYLISWAITLTSGARICDPTSGLRLYHKNMIREFAENLNYAPEPDTISYLIRNGARVREVQVEMAERTAGESYFNFVGSVKYMLRTVISILLIQWFRKRDARPDFIRREDAGI